MRILVIIFAALSIVSCSSTEEKIDLASAEKAFKEAKEYEDDERYEEALLRYDEIKSKFPYSSYAKESDLRIADVYFKKEDYTASALAYANFKFLYPNHPRIPYASLQLALSYFNQLPRTIDRDLSPGYNAIQEFQVVIQKYPDTEFANSARSKKLETEKKLLQKEKYIADFYFKKEQYLSALKRYEKLQSLPGPDNIKRTSLLKGAESAFEIGEMERGQALLSKLQSDYPKSSEAKEARSIKEKYGIR